MSALTVQNAEIKTATVEVKTLTISGKQVTLAVFRQLREAPLINHDGTFAGVPWGVVNYHPDKSCDRSSMEGHLHVVWQQGAELRRAATAPPYFSERIWCESGAAWLHAAILDGWRPTREIAYGQASISVRWDGIGVAEIDLDDELNCALRGKLLYRGSAVLDPIDLIRERVEIRGATREQLDAEVAEELSAEQLRRERHRRRWAELQELPQLFIAV